MGDAESEKPVALKRRRGGRLRLGLQGVVTTHFQNVRVILCDLSPDGAKVYSSNPMQTGRDVYLSWSNYKMFATVIWGKSGFFGLQFETPLTDSVILAARRSWEENQVPETELERWLTNREWNFGKSLI